MRIAQHMLIETNAVFAYKNDDDFFGTHLKQMRPNASKIEEGRNARDDAATQT